MALSGGAALQISAGRMSMDAAALYLREKGWSILGWYLLAIGPLAAACWMWIDSIAAEDRVGLSLASGLVVLAMLWRWAGMVIVQGIVMRDLGRTVKLPVTIDRDISRP